MMTHSIRSIIIILILMVLTAGIHLFSAPAEAGEHKTLITAGPSWEGFTETDGRGLYHDLISRIFSDYTVTHYYVPTVQANAMVAIGRADIKMCETKQEPSLLMSTVPMYTNHYYVVFRRDRIQWQGDATLAGKLVATREGYYTSEDFPVGVSFIEVRSGMAGLKMVVHGRADFYVDDMKLVQQSFKEAGEPLDDNEYGIEKVGTRRYFPVFTDSPRGRMLRDHYEQGMRKLSSAGELPAIYATYGFQVPRLDFAAHK